MKRSVTTVSLGIVFGMLTQTVGAEELPDPQGSIIIVDGFVSLSAYDTNPLPGVFHDWRSNGDDVPECVPTVRLELFDDRKDKSVGFIYAWGQDFTASADGGTLQFREFIYLELNRGDLYTISAAPGHPAGAFADPASRAPSCCLAAPKGRSSEEPESTRQPAATIPRV